MPYDPLVVNLSLSDPNCINAEDECTAYYAAQNASQDEISWAYQFEYGHWVTYYYVISKIPSPNHCSKGVWFLDAGFSVLQMQKEDSLS